MNYLEEAALNTLTPILGWRFKWDLATRRHNAANCRPISTTAGRGLELQWLYLPMTLRRNCDSRRCWDACTWLLAHDRTFASCRVPVVMASYAPKRLPNCVTRIAIFWVRTAGPPFVARYATNSLKIF